MLGRIAELSLFLITACFALAPAPLQAADTQGTAFSFLELSEDARAVGMAEAYTVWAEDIDAIDWDPAGLAKIDSEVAGASYLDYVTDIQSGSAGYARPLLGGGMGFRVAYVNYGKLPADALDASPVYDWPYSLEATLAYGRPLTPEWRSGLAVKGVFEELLGYSAHGIAIDAGVLYAPQALKPFRAGLTLKNLGIQTKAFITETARFPFSVTLGLGYGLFSDSLRLAADVSYRTESRGFDINGGGEYNWHDLFFLRAGYRLEGIDPGAGTQDDPLTGLCAGLGFRWAGCRLDYAYVPGSQLGAVHRASLSVYWGEAPPARPALSPPLRETVSSAMPAAAAPRMNRPGALVAVSPAGAEKNLATGAEATHAPTAGNPVVSAAAAPPAKTMKKPAKNHLRNHKSPKQRRFRRHHRASSL